MLPGIELTNCTGLAVPHEVMHHVVRVESSFNPYAIGVVGGRLVRQPKTLPEAVATVRMLERRGYNFSIGVAQVNRYNLGKYGLDSYEKAFDVCPNLQAGSRILAECYQRSQDWGKSFSCYYSGNFVTGFRHGYVQKIYASMRKGQAGATEMGAIAVIDNPKAGGAAAAAPAAYAPGRRSMVARAEPLTAREPDTAATQAALSAAAIAAPMPARVLSAAQPMPAAANLAAALPQAPVNVSMVHAPAAAAGRAPPAKPPSQGDQAFVF
jgi:type IV secretion system protein VirB1